MAERQIKHLWMVEDSPDGKSRWTKVGVAFANADGSLDIQLAAIPVNGKLKLTDAMATEAKPAVPGEQAAKNREAFASDVKARLVRDAQFSDELDANTRKIEKDGKP